MKLTDKQILTLRAESVHWWPFTETEDIHALATEVLETRALLASFDEDRLTEIITDSIDLDWTPRTAARAIVRAMKGASHE
jgi:hypothetical protein